jgi:CRISPR-associated endonuclease Cas1
MQPQATPSPIAVTRDGICVVDGYGIEIRVDRGHLVIADGVGRIQRSSRFARATCGLRRLVLLGHTGYVTLEALRWLDDVGVRLIHLDTDGRILATSSSLGLDDPRLRRAQALAYGTRVGNAIARSILDRKLGGQRRVAERIGRPDVAAVINGLRTDLDRAASPAELLVPEAAAANAYWSAWAEIAPTWARRDEHAVSLHWRTFGTRASPLTGNPRLAANPANALLNYLYALLEAEARLACFGVGLDPGLGVLHADQRGRDSMALDLMEVVRPDVDDAALELLSSRVWRASDFFETRQGNCRLVAPVTHELTRTSASWSRLIAPVAEGVARDLAVGEASRITRMPTPLTQRNRVKGRDGLRRRTPVPAATLESRHTACVACGGRVTRGRRYCDDCRPGLDAFQGVGTNELARRRRDGSDPAHGGEVARIRGEKWRERRTLEAAWERTHGKADSVEFTDRILPGLVGLPTRRLVEVTGLTRAYCARVQKGECVPHPRHWPNLAIAARDPRVGQP